MRHTSLILVFALACSASSAQAEAAKRALERSAPFSSSLPYVPVPAGRFAGWCGRDDAFLMHHPPGSRSYNLHHSNGRKIATIALGPDLAGTGPRCDEKAENVLFNLGTDSEVVAFNLATERVTIPLTYKGSKSTNVTAVISLAPNLRYLAYNPSTIKPDQWIASHALETLEVQEGPIYWKNDSSMLFAFRRPQNWKPGSDRGPYRTTLDVIRVETRDVTSGQLPLGFDPVWGGGFARSGDELLLFLKRVSEFTGTYFRCRVKPFRCRAIASQVDDFSTNEREVVVTRAFFDRPLPEPLDGEPTPDRFVVEVFDSNSRSLRVAQFAPHAALLVDARISPSGRRIAMRWRREMCHSDADLPRCERGVIFSLDRRR